MSRAPAERVFGAGEESLLDILDHVLNKGVVLTGDLTIGLAQVELIYARLSVLLCAAERVLPAMPAPRRGGRRPRAAPRRSAPVPRRPGSPPRRPVRPPPRSAVPPPRPAPLPRTPAPRRPGAPPRRPGGR